MYELDFEKFKDIFFQEARDHLGAVDALLVKYKENPKDQNALFELFRIAHTLKSMSATMGFDGLTPLVTELSRTLDKLHKGKAISNSSAVGIVTDCFAGVKSLVDEVASGEKKDVPAADLIEQLKSITEVKQVDQDIALIKDMFFSEVKGYLEFVHEPLTKLIVAPKDMEQLFEIFRIAHTIKGMAATMGYDRLTRLAIVMSDVLNEMREGRLAANEESIRLVTACFDTVAALVDEAAAGEDWNIPVEPHIEKLNALCRA